MRILGKNRNTLKMQVRSQHGTVMDALYFGDIEQILTYIMQKHGESETEKCLIIGTLSVIKKRFKKMC